MAEGPVTHMCMVDAPMTYTNFVFDVFYKLGIKSMWLQQEALPSGKLRAIILVTLNSLYSQ